MQGTWCVSIDTCSFAIVCVNHAWEEIILWCWCFVNFSCGDMMIYGIFLWWKTRRHYRCREKSFEWCTTFCVVSIEDWRRPHLEQNNWASISYIEQKPFKSDSINFALGLFPITFVSNKMCQVFKEWLYFKPSWKKMKFLASGLWTINNIFLCFA